MPNKHRICNEAFFQLMSSYYTKIKIRRTVQNRIVEEINIAILNMSHDKLIIFFR